MNKQKTIRILIQIIIFILSLSSAVTVFGIISYANYTLFNHDIITTIFTYIGSIGIGMVVWYLVATYLGKLFHSFQRQPTPYVVMKTFPQNHRCITNIYNIEEEKPSWLKPTKPLK